MLEIYGVVICDHYFSVLHYLKVGYLGGGGSDRRGGGRGKGNRLMDSRHDSRAWDRRRHRDW